MCGFAGFLGGNQTEPGAHESLLQMGQTIVHRGPDDHGIWFDALHQVGFSHRRLAIVDLSPAGHQPMTSVSQRYVIAFNGEIYNHQLLRAELATTGLVVNWRGHSDTETLLACFDYWGVLPTIHRLVGMFSIAVWDAEAGELTLVRDRLGEKPLYYGWNNGVFLFGSELKALRCHPSFNGSIDREALALFMQYSYVPAPHSIYQGIKKLEAGHFLCLKTGHQADAVSAPYWELQQQQDPAEYNRVTEQGTEQKIIGHLHQLIQQSVQDQMMSDVPVGAFLSGGVDSSLIVAVMQAQSSSAVKTFTIGFSEQSFDEAPYAAQVSAHLGTEHTELYVSDADTLSVVPKLAHIYDEPFADSSQIPTYLVSALARQQVTVALSGDAGDELFAGYSRYQHCLNSWQRIQQLPGLGRSLLAHSCQLLSPFQINQICHAVGIKPEGANPGHRLAKLAQACQSSSFVHYYANMLSHITFPHNLVLQTKGVGSQFSEFAALSATTDSLMIVDAKTYLPDDILTKVDRASMAVSLESRIPLLDHRIVRFAQQLPLEWKFREGQTKWCLRRILDQYVPRSLIERPKKGFGVPLAAWLRGPLKTWAASLLDGEILQQQGYLNAGLVEKMWQQHQQNVADWHFQLWNILIFQQWLQDQSGHNSAGRFH